MDKPLVLSVSNVHSESRPRGLTLTAEPTEGAIPGTVPGDRTDDRKAAGNGPGGGSTITSNRERRCASRRTVGPSGRFAVPGGATEARSQARGVASGPGGLVCCIGRARRRWPRHARDPVTMACVAARSTDEEGSLVRPGLSHRLYHYPSEGAYVKVVPNYIGFRYDGRLQSVHHVDGYELVDTPHGHVPGAPALAWDFPHFLLRLGPPMRPDHVVRTGGLYGSARHWADLDLLLTSTTVREAVDATKTRRPD